VRFEERDLHFAFDKLDWREQDGRKGAGNSSATDESRKRQFFGIREDGCVEGFLGKPILAYCQVCRSSRTVTYTEEEAASLHCSSNQRRANASVESQYSILANGLPKAIERTRVAQRPGVWLCLKANLDGIERVFYSLADDAGG
jgi:hypothetical protein